MSTKIKIHVTKEILERSAYCGLRKPINMCNGKDIMEMPIMKEGQIGSNCAVALAIWDIFPNAWVNGTFIKFYSLSGEETGRSKLPMPIPKYINDFDGNSPELRRIMKPISFEIDVPDEVIDEISIGEITERLKDCKTIELV